MTRLWCVLSRTSARSTSASIASVLGMAYALSSDVSIAEDLCQDAFMAAFHRWSEVGAMDHPGAWVRRVVANRSASRFRRLAAEGRALLRLGRPAHEIPSPSADSVAVWTALRRLPPRQAEMVVLTYFAVGLAETGWNPVVPSRVCGTLLETGSTPIRPIARPRGLGMSRLSGYTSSRRSVIVQSGRWLRRTSSDA